MKTQFDFQLRNVAYKLFALLFRSLLHFGHGVRNSIFEVMFTQ